MSRQAKITEYGFLASGRRPYLLVMEKRRKSTAESLARARKILERMSKRYRLPASLFDVSVLEPYFAVAGVRKKGHRIIMVEQEAEEYNVDVKISDKTLKTHTHSLSLAIAEDLRDLERKYQRIVFIVTSGPIKRAVLAAVAHKHVAWPDNIILISVCGSLGKHEGDVAKALKSIKTLTSIVIIGTPRSDADKEVENVRNALLYLHSL